MSYHLFSPALQTDGCNVKTKGKEKSPQQLHAQTEQEINKYTQHPTVHALGTGYKARHGYTWVVQLTVVTAQRDSLPNVLIATTNNNYYL